MSVNHLIQVMQAQILLMNELAGVEKRMLAAVLDRDAGGVQRASERSAVLSDHLAQAEDVRFALMVQIAQALGLVLHGEPTAESAELYDRIVLRASATEREQLTTIRREFRVAAQVLVGINRNLRVYAESQLITLDSFLVELFPQRTQSVYGSDGRQAGSTHPRLVNRQA